MKSKVVLLLIATIMSASLLIGCPPESKPDEKKKSKEAQLKGLTVATNAAIEKAEFKPGNAISLNDFEGWLDNSYTLKDADTGLLEIKTVAQTTSQAISLALTISDKANAEIAGPLGATAKPTASSFAEIENLGAVAKTVSNNQLLYVKVIAQDGVTEFYNRIQVLLYTDVFTVTFNKNGGDTEAVPNTREVPAGGRAQLPTEPTRSGYQFTKWTLDAAGTGAEFTGTTPVTASITVYAQWAPLLTVTFDKNDGDTEANPTTATTIANGTVTLPTSPTKAGYSFDKWTVGQAASTATFTATTPVTASMTVYAQYVEATYTVTFSMNFRIPDGTTPTFGTPVEIKGIAGASGLGALFPSDKPSRTGYAFDKWTVASAATSDAFTATTAITANRTVYAQWTEVTVSYHINYGTPVLNGQTIDPIWNTAPDYYINKTHQDGFTTAAATNSFRKTASTYGATSGGLGASYSYGVAKVLWDDDGLWVMVRVADSEVTRETSNTELTNSSSLANASDRHDSVEVLLNERGDATSAKIDIPDYRGREAGDGVEAIAPFGGVYRVAARGMVSSGFVGGTSGTGTITSLPASPLDGAASGITKSAAFLIADDHPLAVDGFAGYVVIYQAPWVAKTAYPAVNGKKIGLEFQINACRGAGGSLTLAGSNGRAGTMTWHDDLADNVYHENNVTRYAEMTLTGKGGGPAPTEYEITFDVNATSVTGASAAPAKQTTASGKLATVPTITSTSHDFDGWTEDQAGAGAKVTTDTVFAKITVLYAQWTAKVVVTEKFTVTFNYNMGDCEGTLGGDNEATREVTKDAAVGTLPIPTCDKCDFKGWTVGAESSTAEFKATDVITANIEVFAQWDEKDEGSP